MCPNGHFLRFQIKFNEKEGKKNWLSLYSIPF